MRRDHKPRAGIKKSSERPKNPIDSEELASFGQNASFFTYVIGIIAEKERCDCLSCPRLGFADGHDKRGKSVYFCIAADWLVLRHFLRKSRVQSEGPFRLFHTALLSRPARHYPRFRIRPSSSERRGDFNPHNSRAAQRTLCPRPTPVRSAAKTTLRPRPPTARVSPDYPHHPSDVPCPLLRRIDLCHEASARPVTHPSRSLATGTIDNSPGGTFLHW